MLIFLFPFGFLLVGELWSLYFRKDALETSRMRRHVKNGGFQLECIEAKRSLDCRTPRIVHASFLTSSL